MTKKEIREYLDKVDELGRKLKGEDREVFEWVIFGYNECAKLLNSTEKELLQCKCRLDSAIAYNKELCELYDSGMELSNAQTNLILLGEYDDDLDKIHDIVKNELKNLKGDENA